MSTIKDIIYIAGIIIAVLFYFRDKATKGAVIEEQTKIMIENQRIIIDKIHEIDLRFEKQAEINGRVIMYIDIDSRQ